MGTPRTNILLSEVYAPMRASGGISLIQPIARMNFGDHADEVTFTLSVAGATAGTTAWSLGAKLQFCLPHVGSYQYKGARWFDLQDENVEACVLEKVGFYGGANPKPVGGASGIIATQADGVTASAPRTVQRTVRGFGPDVRVVLDLTASGGADPGVLVSLIAHAR